VAVTARSTVPSTLFLVQMIVVDGSASATASTTATIR